VRPWASAVVAATIDPRFGIKAKAHGQKGTVRGPPAVAASLSVSRPTNWRRKAASTSICPYPAREAIRDAVYNAKARSPTAGKAMTENPLVPVEVIERRIYLIRKQKVMLDQDLAELYGVTTGNLNLAVRRNPLRFPEDFMFQLSTEEMKSLILQSARAKGRGGRRTPPYAFTEQGVAM